MNRYFVVLYFCVLSGINGAPQNSNQNNYCSIVQFQCNSGQCIEEEFLCDGKSHCSDSSDEILNSCGVISCPSSTFRCNYGACVSRGAQCDGLADCADGSDETVSLCGTKMPFASPQVRWNCLIPGNPANGKYIVNGQPVTDQSYATNSSTLFLNCDAGYNIIDQSETYFSICLNGAWMPNPLVCSPNNLDKASQITTSNSCSIDQFQCNSGECIAEELLCNGNPECSDSSDETSKSCSRIHCPIKTFRCDYGACVNRNARCNGYADCVDRSDESSCITKTNPTSPVPAPASAPVKRNCLIPANPANGKYGINDQLAIYQSYAPNLSTIFVNCDEGYSNDPPETFYSICRNGVWMPNPPTCSRSCSSLSRRRNQGIRCDYQGKPLQSCNNSVHGVRATGPCFENSGVANCAYLCNFGNWEQISNVIPSLH